MGVAVDTTCGIAVQLFVLLSDVPRDEIVALAAAEHVATEDTRAYAVLVFVELAVFLGEVDRNIATIGIYAILDGIRHRVGSAIAMQLHAADDTAAHVDSGTGLHVAVLAATEHVAHHLGVPLNGDDGAVGKRQILDFVARDTTARTEHPAFVSTEVLEGRVDILLLGQRS